MSVGSPTQQTVVMLTSWTTDLLIVTKDSDSCEWREDANHRFDYYSSASFSIVNKDAEI